MVRIIDHSRILWSNRRQINSSRLLWLRCLLIRLIILHCKFLIIPLTHKIRTWWSVHFEILLRWFGWMFLGLNFFIVYKPVIVEPISFRLIWLRIRGQRLVSNIKCTLRFLLFETRRRISLNLRLLNLQARFKLLVRS